MLFRQTVDMIPNMCDGFLIIQRDFVRIRQAGNHHLHSVCFRFIFRKTEQLEHFRLDRPEPFNISHLVLLTCRQAVKCLPHVFHPCFIFQSQLFWIRQIRNQGFHLFYGIHFFFSFFQFSDSCFKRFQFIDVHYQLLFCRIELIDALTNRFDFFFIRQCDPFHIRQSINECNNHFHDSVRFVNPFPFGIKHFISGAAAWNHRQRLAFKVRIVIPTGETVPFVSEIVLCRQFDVTVINRVSFRNVASDEFPAIRMEFNLVFYRFVLGVQCDVMFRHHQLFARIIFRSAAVRFCIPMGERFAVNLRTGRNLNQSIW